MKKFLLEGVIAIPTAGLLAYFCQMELPIIIFALAMLLDLGTGLAKAWTKKNLSSKIGFNGAAKKVASIVAVIISVGVDLLLPTALASVGIPYTPKMIFGLLVLLWLCVNEFISVLENLNALGVPFPPFFQKFVNALKEKVEQSGENAANSVLPASDESVNSQVEDSDDG
ncbi:MAG: phage holin family protein [Oscillospiraceae bacterium]|nr:phage holin family protein [Oscillospiraceae bacterium]